MGGENKKRRVEKVFCQNNILTNIIICCKQQKRIVSTVNIRKVTVKGTVDHFTMYI